MNRWTWVRVAVVAFSFVAALFQGSDSASVSSSDWGTLIASLVLTPIALLIVIGIQRLNSRSAPVWRYPRWSINPFTMKEPLQFFHLAGYVFLAGGVGYLIRSTLNHMPMTLETLLWITTGIGVLIGIQLCVIAFRSKMERGERQRV